MKIERWTQEQITSFDNLRKQGFTLNQIGQRIGKTIEQCKNRAYKVNKRAQQPKERKVRAFTPLYTKETIDAVIKRRMELISYYDLAREFDLPETTICYLVNKYKINYPQYDEAKIRAAMCKKNKPEYNIPKGELISKPDTSRDYLSRAKEHFKGQYTIDGSYYILNGKKLLVGQFITAYLDTLRKVN